MSFPFKDNDPSRIFLVVLEGENPLPFSGGTNSVKVDPIQKGSKTKNGRIAFSENILVHINNFSISKSGCVKMFYPMSRAQLFIASLASRAR